jgi:glutamate racemase
MTHPIGIFDSGYGGLTIFRAIADTLPHHDYIYLGDNARAPYGNRSFETVYRYTLQCVEWFFDQGCPLVILACNTASAKALRTIQQKDLPRWGNDKRVLGVIRPTAEVVHRYTRSGKVGILGTKGTVSSQSYVTEIKHFAPEVEVYQQACPLWVPFIENNEYLTDGIDYYIQKDLESLFAQNASIDTLLLACTHYPLLTEKILKFLPEGVKLVSQGKIVADSLLDYLQRHPEMDARLSKTGQKRFYTTDDDIDFEEHATHFFCEPVDAEYVRIGSDL